MYGKYMKKRNKNHRKKSLIILLIGIMLIFTPALMMQIIQAQGMQINDSRIASFHSSGSSIYDLLVIAPKKYADALHPLIIHKNQVGVRTHLVTLDDVYHQMFWQGRDNQEKIKYFIKIAKEEWGITYVLLVGDFRTIPVRYVYNADNNTGWDEPCFISELYYADLYDKNHNFSSWDTDNNGVYG
ncbi:MAG TPA: hypothetical protein ENO12_00160, partial [Thermoplasmatales archaeon]|nr:hypothetical protein [Thermoplasmatales archaeon]